ncbi:MAG: hypothetical protein CMK65_00210 [Pseudoalteromonas sp.]|uniref:motility associated factor glycosyltransferase family protein n=1 Tax=Pseudoalteromonas sp. TaxID=53249 RepID=UPI000C92E877|nr:6-hydroxymethylpterin diphosphokinase MptE-like protein [Pseudoalteromonas sp.]MAD02035.1 hypothetical protein [Pseudoalteromonas sp.]|tara:strand:- start:8509 stop:10641 length:2133 start_codon:yes stop_codon:yes gene_type:complete
MCSNHESQTINELETQIKGELSRLEKKQTFERMLNESMPKIFNNNITAFEKYLPDLAARFKNYKTKEVNLFCTESGHVNIMDKQNNCPLYDENPIKQSKTQLDEFIKNPKLTSINYSLDDGVENNFIHTKYMTEMHNLYLEAEQKLAPLESLPEHLSSMIIFGVGLGYHLPLILDVMTVDHLYICEPNSDWFYASLYVCDWASILKEIDERNGSVNLHIGVSYKEFTSDFLNNIKNIGSFYAINAAIYQHYPSDELTKIIQKFSSEFHLMSVGWGFFDDAVISIAHDYANAEKGIPFLKKDASIPKPYKDMPVFIVANGPSIDNTIQTIKEYEDKAIIFSCGSAIQTLLKSDIIPDFHLEIERTKFTYDYLAEFIDNDAMKKINFLTGNIMHPQCAELFKWTGMAFKPTEASTVLASELINKNQDFAQIKFCNPVVGNTATSFACYMGFEEIYLFGMDCGYKDPTLHHSKHSLYYTQDGKEKESIGNLVRSGEISVDGNFGGKIISTSFLNTGKFYLEHLLALFPKVNCYNCSDGALIEHTTPLNSSDILLCSSHINKFKLIDIIKSDLFIDRNFSEQEYIDWLAIDQFNEICDKITIFLDRKFSSRAEFATAMMEQVRYLFNFSHTPYRHIYFALEGSITYIHSVFTLILYDFEDEIQTMEYINKCIDIFKVYMFEAKSKFKRVIEEIDSQECYLMDMFREDINKKSQV